MSASGIRGQATPQHEMSVTQTDHSIRVSKHTVLVDFDSDSTLSDIDEAVIERGPIFNAKRRVASSSCLLQDSRTKSQKRTRVAKYYSPLRRSGTAAITPPKSVSQDGSSITLTDSPIEPDISSSTPKLKLTLQHLGGGKIGIKPLSLLLSRVLCNRRSPEVRPQPQGVPRVWADSRQALYETLPYFKKPQGGCHQNDRHVYAFMFDGDGHNREYMDEDVIIARTTGGMDWDEAGNLVQKKHQSMNDANPRAIINDIACYNPVVIICGDRHTGAHIQLPHRYCVLGWYKPIGVWAEKSLGKGGVYWTTIKVRLERLGCDEEPWHAPREDSVKEFRKLASQYTLRYEECATCRKQSPQVYLEMWTCLNQECPQFWRTAPGPELYGGDLHFNPAFLVSRTPWAKEKAPFDVRIPLPQIGLTIGDNITYLNTRGVVCPNCGRCNSRYLFRKWICDNFECTWTGLQANTGPIPLPALHLPWENIGQGPSLARNRHENDVHLEVTYKTDYKICTYTFTGIDGHIIHAIANADSNNEPRGPNDMFAAIQLTDLGLERRRFDRQLCAAPRTKLSKRQAASKPCEDVTEGNESLQLSDTVVVGGDFMTAFSANYGVSYKFVAKGATRPFENSAWPILEGRSRLNWARRQFLAGNDQEGFNELLAIAYMDGQRMDYHDDGEHGLGPCVASLSLGCKARMSWRIKAKHYVGCSKSGVLTRDRPLPFSVGNKDTYQKRKDAWEEVQMLEQDNSPHLQERLKALPHELGIFDVRHKKATDLLTITLSHGDIMLMDGHELQKYLEHRVISEGLLRFSMTCREISASHLQENGS